jgi:hypothetical protein
MFAQSVNKAKRPREVTTLEAKLKIIADYGVGKRAVNIGREMKKTRIQTNPNSFSRRGMIQGPQLPHFKFIQ